MKQSSIEWFHQETWKLRVQLDNKEVTLGEYATKYYELYQQAKAMHKEEIENAVKQGWDYNEEGLVQWMGEKYYNETFNIK